MTRLFVANTNWARRACVFNCQHRDLAGRLDVVANPQLPASISRTASLHTWPAYRDAMEHLVAGTDWKHYISAASDAGTEIRCTWGSKDRIGDWQYARTAPTAINIVPGAGHHLPLTHPDTCLSHLTA
jgi:pimeloyl-ACP methyl ester carboxylesterase